MMRKTQPTHKLMSNYRRTNIKDDTCFFTVVTYRRQRFLRDKNIWNALREGIKATQSTHSVRNASKNIFRNTTP